MENLRKLQERQSDILSSQLLASFVRAFRLKFIELEERDYCRFINDLNTREPIFVIQKYKEKKSIF